MTREMKSIVGKLCMLTIFILFALFVVMGIQRMRQAAEHSEYAALTAETTRNLHNFYLQHGQYPDSLNELPNPTFPEGGDPSYLSDLSYSSKGNSYELLVVSPHYKWTGRNVDGKQGYGKCE